MCIFSNPPHFSPTFPILHAVHGWECVLYSAHMYALSSCTNVPTNLPIPPLHPHQGPPWQVPPPPKKKSLALQDGPAHVRAGGGAARGRRKCSVQLREGGATAALRRRCGGVGVLFTAKRRWGGEERGDVGTVSSGVRAV